MKQRWNAKAAMAWATSGPRPRNAHVWRMGNNIVATDGCCLVMQPGPGSSLTLPHAAAVDFIRSISTVRLRRAFIASPRFRAWLAARAAEKVTEWDAVQVSICGRRFDARLLHHVIKIASEGAKVALEVGSELNPLHVSADGFSACVMPMVKSRLRWAARRTWPRSRT